MSGSFTHNVGHSETTSRISILFRQDVGEVSPNGPIGTSHEKVGHHMGAIRSTSHADLPRADLNWPILDASNLDAKIH